MRWQKTGLLTRNNTKFITKIEKMKFNSGLKSLQQTHVIEIGLYVMYLEIGL